MEALLSHLEQIKREESFDVEILGANPDARIPGLEGPRANCVRRGIFDSDVVFVPLEDGDRCEALMAMGKTVLVVDLNPLSRTAQMASVTMVDELTRVVANMNIALTNQPRLSVDDTFQNEEALSAVLVHIRDYITSA